MARNVQQTLNMIEIEKMASNLLQSVCSIAGCDLPDNKDDIITFIVEDVEATADPENWHSGDIGIAFRRWMERDFES